jgi:hypothetical protein
VFDKQFAARTQSLPHFYEYDQTQLRFDPEASSVSRDALSATTAKYLSNDRKEEPNGLWVHRCSSSTTRKENGARKMHF